MYYSEIIRNCKLEVPNKYNLIGSDIEHIVLADRSQVKGPLFWRNNVINAWCILAEVGDDLCGDEFWIGIYDEPHHKKLVRAYYTSLGGMCGYKFSKFYSPGDIDTLSDLYIHKESLKILNKLLDRGIIEIHRPSGKKITKKET